MTEGFKEGMNQSLKDIYKSTNSGKEMNKTVQDTRVKIESIKKAKAERNLEMKNLGRGRRTS